MQKRIRITGPKEKIKKSLPNNSVLIYTVSRAKSWSRGLSPFYIGPCNLYGGHIAERMENGWQYAKVYKQHTDAGGDPTDEYWKWAKKGWSDQWAHRYPMGKGAKPEYCLWDGEKLGYIEARKKVYVPLYWKAVKKTPAYKNLKQIYETTDQIIYLWDFDGYNYESLGMSLLDVINDPTRTMGHAFILARMLEKGV